MNKPIVQLALLQLKEFVRQPGVLFWAIGFPLLMAWILGLAFNRKNEINYHIAVIQNSKNHFDGLCKPDADDTKITHSNKTPKKSRNILCSVVKKKEDAYQLIRQGKILLLLEASEEHLNIHFDSKNGESEKAYFLLKDRLRPNLNENIKIQEKMIQSKGNRYIDFLIPGLIALSILNSCFWGVGWNLIELRVKRLLRRMIATPMSKSHFMLSFALVRIFIGFIEFSLLYAFAYYYFGVIIQGSLLGLFLIFIIANISFTGMSILIASRPNNTRVGNGVINAATIPMTILSGIFFSYHGLPEPAVFIIKLMPLTTLADTIRGIFNEGFTFLQVLKPSLILLSEGVISFILGIKFFKWQ